jgi:transposase
MAHPLSISIKESIVSLRKMQRKQSELISKRIQVLIEIKKREKEGISKRALSDITGVNHNSIVKWRNMYLQGGINLLLKHGRKGGFKPSIVSAEEHEKLKLLLHDPKNGIRGYKELLQWVSTELGKEMKYTTLVEYTKRHFQSKIKVARKSHLKKDDTLVTTFKKTSVVKSKK